MNEPVIKFKGYSIKKMFYSRDPIETGEIKEGDDNEGFTLSSEQSISEDLQKAKLSLTVVLENKDKSVYIVTEVESYFEINNIESIDDIRKILLVNGTAIVYPYLRSIISMVTSLDAGEAIILPTINTTTLAD